MSKPARVGLSEYTARRLAELRARRAEADDNGSFQTSSSSISVNQTDSPLENGNCKVDETSHRNSVAEISVSSTDQNSNVDCARVTNINTAKLRSEYFNSTPTLSSSVTQNSGIAQSSSSGSASKTSNTEVGLSESKLYLNTRSAELSSVSRNADKSSIVDGYRRTEPTSTVAVPSARATAVVCNDGVSRTESSHQCIPETDSKSYQRGFLSNSSFVSTADSDTSRTPELVAVSNGLSMHSTSSNSLQAVNTHISPRPAVSAKPTAAAISLALSASARPASEADCIGFASLPDQLHRKAARRGFDFTVMVVGETGLGKSTLLSNLFCKFDLYKDREEPDVNKTMKLEKRYVEIEDHGIRLRLTIVDTPGYGDTINTNHCWELIEQYIAEQFEQYYNDETGLNRHNIKDNRVHCCLYFVSPYGRGLRPLDIECMKRLQNKVNIVPVIGKADTLTPAESKQLKLAILRDIKKNNIRTYEMPPCDDDDDEEYKARDKEMKDSWPFAVIGANSVVEVNGRKIRGRVYPWGFVEAENVLHSDFVKLQQFLISTHLHDLKEVTCDVHYENFRVHRIKEQNNAVMPTAVDTVLEADTESLLRQKEDEIRRMQQMMMQMQAQLSSSSTTRGRQQ